MLRLVVVFKWNEPLCAPFHVLAELSVVSSSYICSPFQLWCSCWSPRHPCGRARSLGGPRCSAMQGIGALGLLVGRGARIRSGQGGRHQGWVTERLKAAQGPPLGRTIPEIIDKKWNKRNLGESEKPDGWREFNSDGLGDERVVSKAATVSLEKGFQCFTALCLMCGLIECLFLFLQFWLVDHTRSHWPAGWSLAFLASWRCSTDDESFQEPHLSAQWQTLPQLSLFHPHPPPPPRPLPPLVPLSRPHRPSIYPPSHPPTAWLNSSTGPSSVPAMLPSSLFAPHSLTDSSSSSKIANIFNHFRVFSPVR